MGGDGFLLNAITGVFAFAWGILDIATMIKDSVGTRNAQIAFFWLQQVYAIVAAYLGWKVPDVSCTVSAVYFWFIGVVLGCVQVFKAHGANTPYDL